MPAKYLKVINRQRYVHTYENILCYHTMDCVPHIIKIKNKQCLYLLDIFDIHEFWVLMQSLGWYILPQTRALKMEKTSYPYCHDYWHALRRAGSSWLKFSEVSGVPKSTVRYTVEYEGDVTKYRLFFFFFLSYLKWFCFILVSPLFCFSQPHFRLYIDLYLLLIYIFALYTEC